MNKYLVLNCEDMKFNVIDGNDYSTTYDMLKENVGGYIECVSWINCLSGRGIDVWVNENGKLDNLPPSVILHDNGKIIDILAGNLVFARKEGENTVPLFEEDIEYIIKKIIEREMVSQKKVYLADIN